jgi:hypothetical protein
VPFSYPPSFILSIILEIPALFNPQKKASQRAHPNIIILTAKKNNVTVIVSKLFFNTILFLSPRHTIESATLMTINPASINPNGRKAVATAKMLDTQIYALSPLDIVFVFSIATLSYLTLLVSQKQPVTKPIRWMGELTT